jgi:hypothetical protein
MSVTMLRVVRVLLFVVASCLGGWLLGAYISRTPFWIPDWLWHATRAAVQMSGSDALYNEDDVEALCLLSLFVASCTAVASALALFWLLTTHSHCKRRNARLTNARRRQ